MLIEWNVGAHKAAVGASQNYMSMQAYRLPWASFSRALEAVPGALSHGPHAGFLGLVVGNSVHIL